MRSESFRTAEDWGACALPETTVGGIDGWARWLAAAVNMAMVERERGRSEAAAGTERVG